MARAIHLLVYSCLFLQIAECSQRKTWALDGKLQRKIHPYKSPSTTHTREPDEDIYGEITPKRSPYLSRLLTHPKDNDEDDYNGKGEDEEEPDFFYGHHPIKWNKKQANIDYIINENTNGNKRSKEEGEKEGDKYKENSGILKRRGNRTSTQNFATEGGDNEYLDRGKVRKINPLKIRSSLIERRKKQDRARDQIRYATQPVSSKIIGKENNSRKPYSEDPLPHGPLINSVSDYVEPDMLHVYQYDGDDDPRSTEVNEDKIKYKNGGDVRPQDIHEFVTDHESKTWQSEEQSPQYNFALKSKSRIKNIKEIIKNKKLKGIIPLPTKEKVHRSKWNQQYGKPETLARSLSKKTINYQGKNITYKITNVNKHTNKSDKFRISEHDAESNSENNNSSENPTKATKVKHPKVEKSVLFTEIYTYKSSIETLSGNFKKIISSYTRDFEHFVPYLVPKLHLSYESEEDMPLNLSKSSYNTKIIRECLFAKQEALGEAYFKNVRDILSLYSPWEMDVLLRNLIANVRQSFGTEQAIKKEVSKLKKTSVYKLISTLNFPKDSSSDSYNQAFIAPACKRRVKLYIKEELSHHIPNISEIRQRQSHYGGYAAEGKSRLIFAMAKHSLFSLMIYKNLQSILRHLESILRSFSEIDDHHQYIRKRSITEKDIQGYIDEDRLYVSPTNKSTRTILEQGANYYGQYVANQVVLDFTVYVRYLYKHLVDAVRLENPRQIEVDPSQMNDIIFKRLRPIIAEKMEALPQPTRQSQEDLKRIVLEEIRKKSLTLARQTFSSYIKNEIISVSLKLRSYVYPNADISTPPPYPSSLDVQPSQIPLYEYPTTQDDGLPFYGADSLSPVDHYLRSENGGEKSRPTEEWNYLAQLMTYPITPPLDTIEPVIETVAQKESYQIVSQISLDFNAEVKYVCEYPFILMGKDGKSHRSKSILTKIVRKRIVEHVKHTVPITRILNKMGIEEYYISDTLRQEFTNLVYSVSTPIALDTVNSVLEIESTKLLQYLSTAKTKLTTERSPPQEVYDYHDNASPRDPANQQKLLDIKMTKEGFTIGGTKVNMQEDIVKPAKAILGSLNSNGPLNNIYQCSNRVHSHILSYIGAKLLEDLVKRQVNHYTTDNLDDIQKLSAILFHYFLTKKLEEKSSHQTYEREIGFNEQATKNYTYNFQTEEDSMGDEPHNMPEGGILYEDRGRHNGVQKRIYKLKKQPTEKNNAVSITHEETEPIEFTYKPQPKYKPNISMQQPYFSQKQKFSNEKSPNMVNKGNDDQNGRVRLIEPIYEYAPKGYEPSPQHMKERHNNYYNEDDSDPAPKSTYLGFQKLNPPDPAGDPTVVNGNYDAREMNYNDQLDSERFQHFNGNFPSNINSMSKCRDATNNDNCDSDLPSPITKWGSSSLIQRQNPPPLHRDYSMPSSLNLPLEKQPAGRRPFVNDKGKINTNYEEEGRETFNDSSQTSTSRSLIPYEGYGPNWFRSVLKNLDENPDDDHNVPPQDATLTPSGEERFIRYENEDKEPHRYISQIKYQDTDNNYEDQGNPVSFIKRAPSKLYRVSPVQPMLDKDQPPRFQFENNPSYERRPGTTQNKNLDKIFKRSKPEIENNKTPVINSEENLETRPFRYPEMSNDVEDKEQFNVKNIEIKTASDEDDGTKDLKDGKWLKGRDQRREFQDEISDMFDIRSSLDESLLPSYESSTVKEKLSRRKNKGNFGHSHKPRDYTLLRD